MKKFEISHLFMKTQAVEFTEDNPPDWLLSKEYKWWWDEHVLTLEVGKHINSDFQKIKRIE